MVEYDFLYKGYLQCLLLLFGLCIHQNRNNEKKFMNILCLSFLQYQSLSFYRFTIFFSNFIIPCSIRHGRMLFPNLYVHLQCNFYFEQYLREIHLYFYAYVAIYYVNLVHGDALEARIWNLSPWNCSYWQLSVSIWLLETEPGSSIRATRILNLQVISLYNLVCDFGIFLSSVLYTHI